MRPVDHANSLLTQLGNKLGIASLELEDGICTLDFGDVTQLVMEVPEGSDLLVLFSPLSAVPLELEEREKCYARLLGAHLFGSETKGAWFALRNGEIVLNLMLPIENLDVSTFENAIENFLTSVSEWKARLAKGAVLEEPAQMEDGANGFSFAGMRV